MATSEPYPAWSGRALLAGLGGGLVSAVMFYSAVRGGTGLSLILLPLLPLPTLIAGLATGLGGSVAALAAGMVVALFVASPMAAIGYGLLLGVPAAGVAHLLSLARYDRDGALTHWFPTGQVLAAIALYGAALPMLLITLDGGSYDVLAPELMKMFRQIVAAAPPGSDWQSLDDQALGRLVAISVQVLPAVIACYWTLIFAANVYLAARVVRFSGMLDRPWPNLHWLTLPPALALAPVAAVAGIWLDGGPRLLGVGAIGALLIAFLLQGLAVIHALARTRAAGWALSATYAALIIVGGLAAPLIALLGGGEVLMGLRRRIIPIPADLPPGSL